MLLILDTKFINHSSLWRLSSYGTGLFNPITFFTPLANQSSCLTTEITISASDYYGQAIFPITIGANQDGEVVTFALYNAEEDTYTPVNESIDFVINMTEGNVITPVLFTLGSSYPTVPDCSDNDALVSQYHIYIQLLHYLKVPYKSVKDYHV